jgi:hypothetical protein
MQARLTFATAVAAVPDVLIVDEALSVGDARFQLRCFDRIRQMREQGCTILFVSHSMEQVASLCDRVMLLERGRLLACGPVAEVTRQYQRLLDASPDARGAAAPVPDESGRSDGTGEWRVEPAKVFDASGRAVDVLVPRERYEIRFRATGSRDIEGLRLQFHVRNRNGVVVYGRDPATTLPPGFVARAGETLEFRIRFSCHFGGPYFLASYGLGYADGRYVDFRHDALELRVKASPDLQHASIVDLDADVVCERVERGA